MLRWNPNARPRCAGSLESASSASRGGLRRPLPTRSTKRKPSTAGHAEAVTSPAFATTETL